MEVIPDNAPGVRAGEQGAVMARELAALPEEVLGANVRTMREARGLTQKQVADGMNLLGFKMMYTTIAKIETGKRPIRVNEAFSLAAVLGVHVIYLLGLADIGSSFGDAVLNASQIAATQRNVADYIEEMGRRHRNALRGYLQDQLARLDEDRRMTAGRVTITRPLPPSIQGDE